VPVNCTQTGGLLAGLMLALHWPSGPRPLDAGLWTQVPSDAGLASALVALVLVTFGLGMVRETISINRRQFNSDTTNGPDTITGSSMKFRSSKLSIFIVAATGPAFACALRETPTMGHSRPGFFSIFGVAGPDCRVSYACLRGECRS